MKRKNEQPSSAFAERYFVNEKQGLSSTQVEMREQEGFVNKTKNHLNDSYFKIIIRNVCTFFNLLCFICFIALLCVRAKLSDYSFMVIYLVNLTIGIVQEIRAKITLEKMTIVSTPTSTVIRDGTKKEVNLENLVLDDVIMLSIGDQIPTDCILISGYAEANEALLTGESIPVKKHVGDTLLGGSFITGGTCYARVEKIGNESYVQQLSISAKKHKSPNSKLLTSLNKLIKTIGILIVPFAILMGVINFNVVKFDYVGLELYRRVVTRTSSVIIGMIPAGMFLLTTMALAVGVINLSKINTHAKDKYSLEMLARVDVLCLDKTGTITDGQMAVKEVCELKKLKNITTEKAIFALQSALKDSNQTATALNAYFSSGTELEYTAKIPFSSDRKYSAVTFNKFGTFVLGAPNYIFPELTKKLEEEILKHTSLGRRVLLLAHSNGEIENETIPSDLVPVSLIILEDNVRPEAIETIKWFKENDVCVKVISGDDPLTVSEIARRAGVENYDKYINLNGVLDDELWEIAENYTVFGRVSPEQKAILVKALKKKGHLVAMTGDGVNDILAMKEADCSVTVASGSDAAKSVAQLVLFDDNFNSMPKVVLEGRRVINNIQRSSSLYLMKTIFTMTFAFISILRRSEYPFSPGMMIMIESCVIGLPSFVLSLQPNTARVKGNFISQMLINAIPGAIVLVSNVFAVQLLNGYLGLNLTDETYKTVSVVVLTFGGWAYLVNLCKPFDKYRGCLVAVTTAVLLIWAIFLMDTSFFQLTSFFPIKENWQPLLISICIVQFDFPLLVLCSIVLKKIASLISNYKQKA